MKTTLKIEGLHCSSCKTLIEDVAADTAGISSCAVDVSAGIAAVEYDGSENLDAFAREIESLGEYRVAKN